MGFKYEKFGDNINKNKGQSLIVQHSTTDYFLQTLEILGLNEDSRRGYLL